MGYYQRVHAYLYVKNNSRSTERYNVADNDELFRYWATDFFSDVASRWKLKRDSDSEF